MTEDQMNPNICPSALEQDGTLDTSKWDGAHKWDEQDGTCDECGASQFNDVITCPHCGKDAHENDIEYLGDQQYACPACR